MSLKIEYGKDKRFQVIWDCRSPYASNYWLKDTKKDKVLMALSEGAPGAKQELCDIARMMNELWDEILNPPNESDGG